jgi:hypothetical protein
MRIRPRSPYEGLTSPRRQPPTRFANRNACFPLGKSLAFRDFLSLRTHFWAAFCGRLRVDTRFSLLKYCSRSEPSLNCGSPTLRFGEVLDFSLSFCLRHPAAWPAAFQVMFKNNAESSLFELLRDVFSKNTEQFCRPHQNGRMFSSCLCACFNRWRKPLVYSSSGWWCCSCVSSNARKTSTRCFFSVTRSPCSNSRTTVRYRTVFIGLQVFILVCG